MDLTRTLDLPGVMGGESVRFNAPFATLSAYKLASWPYLTTSYGWKPKHGPSMGVGRGIELDGGLLIVLPEVDSGGVDGEYEHLIPLTFVSKRCKAELSCLKAIDGFRWRGCGDATGVIAMLL